MFDILIGSSPLIQPGKKFFSLIVSIVIHSVVLLVEISVPLFFTESLNPEKFITYLVAPPPPPPRPQPAPLKLEAITTQDGKVADLKLMSGCPLLVRASMGAVSQWMYEPTLLNNEPVSIIFIHYCHFPNALLGAGLCETFHLTIRNS